jgi:hypothetical protein
MRQTIIALAVVLAGCAEQAPTLGDKLVASADRMQADMDAERQRQEDARRQEQRYAALPPSDLMAELKHYCPNISPPCNYSPPSALLREVANRGLIGFRTPPEASQPGTVCVMMGDGLGGGIVDCQ